MDDILDYLSVEAVDGDTLEATDLQFVRTARVEDRDYWIWRFTESDGDEAFVFVTRLPDGGTVLGYDSNDQALSPEQFIWGHHHDAS